MIKTILPRSQVRIILKKPYKTHRVMETIAIYKSQYKQFEALDMMVDKNEKMSIFPFCHFIYQKDNIKHHCYEYETITVCAHVISDIFMHQYVFEVDEDNIDSDLIMLYDKDICEEIIQSKTTVEEMPTDDLKQNKDLKYFIATLKGGHVGKHLYYPMKIGIYAYSLEQATNDAILLPRVKHKTKEDLLDIIEVDGLTYQKQYLENMANAYFNSTNSYESKAWKKEHRHEFIKEKLI